MREKLRVFVDHRYELDVGAGFNDGLENEATELVIRSDEDELGATYLGLGVEHDLQVVAITHAQLLTEDGELGVAAVTDEDR